MSIIARFSTPFGSFVTPYHAFSAPHVAKFLPNARLRLSELGYCAIDSSAEIYLIKLLF